MQGSCFVPRTRTDGGDDATVEQIRKRAKWDNDDYVCKGLILNGMFDSIVDIYQNVESSKELWDFLEAKYMVEDASSKKFLVSCIINKLPLTWKDFKHTLKHMNENLTLVELGNHLRIEESLGIQDNDKPKGNNIVGPLVVNMVEHKNSSRYNDNKGKCKHHDNTKADPNKKSKVTCWKYRKPEHLKKDCKGGKASNKANGSGINGSVDGSTNSLKGQNMFNKSFQAYYVTYVSEAYFVQDDDVASILHMGNESTALVHGHGCADLKFSSGKIVSLCNIFHAPNIKKNLVSSSVLNNCGYKQVIESNKFVLSKLGVFIGFGYLSNQIFRLNIVNDNIASAFMSTSKLVDSILCHARLGHIYFKKMQDMSKDGLILAFDMDTEKWNKKYFVTLIDDASRFCYVYLLHSNDKALDKFQVFKTEVELQQGSQIKRFKTDKRGTRDEVSNQHSYCFSVEDDPKTFDEAMKSQDIAFWKKEVNDEMDSIMATTLGCWLIYLQEVYMNQPQGFIMSGNENKVFKLIKSLYRLKQAPKQQHQKFDKVVLSNGYLLNQADKCIYRKFNESSKGVIICLYVDDKLIFDTGQVLVDMTKEFLSSRFSMKDMDEAHVILGIRIKHESNGIAISKSYYIKKVLKKFNYFDCTPVSTPMDISEKLMPNNGQVVSQLKYSRVIGCLMYAMTCTRPNIALL
uniref:Zinc finger, CCHC-type n=1 Tax=Tanacetum cinerariifolium TaxID=118510 RepID=A0A699GW39_TANCI|nr:zinc finger, CCHC-type [Tanacetum cinerariifolium]